MSDFEWSEYQEAVFDAVDDPDVGHLVVEARAGSAKTTTIVEALNWVPQGESVLLSAFNKGIERDLSAKAPSGVEVRTLHSYGFSTVKRHFDRVQLDKNKTRKLCKGKYEGLDRKMVNGLIRSVSICKNVLASDYDEIMATIKGYQIETGIGMPPRKAEMTTEQILSWQRQEEAVFVKRVYELLEASAEHVKTVDFDDMIWIPTVRELRPWEYDRLFVDEAQDLNPAQQSLIERGLKDGGRLTVVGDRRQAIYGFRGANAGTMSIPGALGLPLPICYRCGSEIVREAQRWVPDIQPWENAESGVVQRVNEQYAGTKTNESSFAEMRSAVVKKADVGDAVLSRTNAPLAKLLIGFLKAGKRAKIMGRDFASRLTSIIQESEATTTKELRSYLEKWLNVQVARCKDDGTNPAYVEDLYACIVNLAEGTSTAAEVRVRVEDYFFDKREGDEPPIDRVVLSTVHKAKGLEWNRVFVLMNTFFKGDEEDNLRYVAVTRAKKELTLAYG